MAKTLPNKTLPKTLSTTPLVDPTASVRECTLGAYTEVGARTQLLEVELGDYSYVVNDSDVAYAAIGKFCSIAAMTRAARLLLGEHDWTAFSSAQADGESRVRTVLDFTIDSHWDSRALANILEFKITANGLLRYMVRSIIGTLIEVGRGEKDSDTMQTAIVTGDRSLAGKTASAHGLTLLKVDYE